MNILYAQSPALFWCALALIVCFFVRRGAHRVRAVLDLVLGLLCVVGGVALYYLGMYNDAFTIRDFWHIRTAGWIGLAVVVLVTVLLIVETFRLLLPGLWSAFSAGDEQALSAYLTSQGRLRSFLTLWFLAVVQVLSLVIPAMPVQLAAGLAYGPWLGFVMSFSASAVANLTVFLAARRLAPVIRRLTADNAKATKLLNSVRSSKDPWFYTILAFITPGLPNGIIPYAAANAGMRPKQFAAAIFISLPIPTLLTCAAGSFILEGNWFFTVLTGIVLFSFVGILFFNRTKFIAWAHEMKDKHTKKAEA